MAGIKIDLQKHTCRQLDKEITQFIVEDDVVFVPLVTRLGKIVGTERFVGTVGLITAKVGHLCAMARHTEDEIGVFARLCAINHRLEVGDNVGFGGLSIGQHGDVVRLKTKLILQQFRHIIGIIHTTLQRGAGIILEVVDPDTQRFFVCSHCSSPFLSELAKN